MNSAANCGPRSNRAVSRRPCNFQTLSLNNVARPWAVTVECVGMMWACLYDGSMWQIKHRILELPVNLVLEGPVQSSLWSKFDKTGTGTSPHRLKDHEKLDWTDVNRSSAVWVSFLRLKDRSQPVSVSTGWQPVLDQSRSYWHWENMDIIN